MRALLLLVACACSKPVERPVAPTDPGPPPADSSVVPVDAPAYAPAPGDAATQVIARLVRIEIVGGESHVTVDKGSSAGIRPDWTACFLDANGRCLPFPLTVIGVKERTTKLRSTATMDQAKTLRDVRLSPP